MNKANTFKGVMLATAAAGIFLAAGCATEGQSTTANSGKVACSGVNSCKGNSACKTTTNNCKGLNSCKGHGFVMMNSDAECKAAYDKMWGGPLGTQVRNEFSK